MEWKRGLVVPLWKGKVDRQDGNNYRGVMQLSVQGKVFARITLDRVHHHLLEHQRPEQLFGSSPNADESFGRGCLQPIMISAKCSIQ